MLPVKSLNTYSVQQVKTLIKAGQNFSLSCSEDGINKVKVTQNQLLSTARAFLSTDLQPVLPLFSLQHLGNSSELQQKTVHLKSNFQTFF